MLETGESTGGSLVAVIYGVRFKIMTLVIFAEVKAKERVCMCVRAHARVYVNAYVCNACV